MDIKYYAEFTADDSTWRNIGRPPLDETWKRRIESFVINGKPLRVVWGGQEEMHTDGDEDVPAGYYHKYQVGSPMRRIVGYKWTEDGKEVFVSALREDAEIPKHALVVPVYEFESVGRPRWIVEVWREEGAGVDFTGYHEAWTIETLELLREGYGRREILSRYAEPNEIDIRRAEHLKYLFEHLTKKDIDKDLTNRARAEAEAKEKRAAEQVEIDTEDFLQFLVDGKGSDEEYEMPAMDINAELKELQKAHQAYAKQYE